MIASAVSTSDSSTTSGGASRSALFPAPSNSSPFWNARVTSSCGTSGAGSREARDSGEQLALYHVERRERRRAAHRIAAERAAVRPRLPLHDRFPGDDRAD